jgi:hypothetical protein
MTFQEYLNRHRVDVEASDNGVELTSMWFAHGLMAREVRDSLNTDSTRTTNGRKVYSLTLLTV